jgi:hypothetical protein
VQRAKALERRLRATGAFGSQLFGPLSDPGGHKDHVHIPTPGGRVKVNAALANLMGLGGKEGMAGDMANWENQAEQEEQRRREDLETRKNRLAMSQAELKIRQATTPLQKAEAEYQRDILRIEQEMAGLTQDDTTAQLKKNLLLDAQLEKTQKIGDLLVAQARQQEGAMRPYLDQIEALEATLKGPAAVKALERRNAVGAMAADKVDPTKAGELFDRRAQLEAMVTAQEELNALWNQGGSILKGLFSDLIQGTNDWQASLARALESLAGLLLEAGLSGLAGKDGVGFFSLLQGGLGRSFAGGGYTGSGSRSGGVDGKGGFPAILHPNETVIDHTRGQGMGQVVNVGGISVSVASDGSSKVDTGSGSQLARGVQAAVTAEILRQKRPGGALAGGR